MIKTRAQRRTAGHNLLQRSLRHAIVTVVSIGGVVAGATGQSQLSGLSPEAGPFSGQPWGEATAKHRTDSETRQHLLAGRLVTASEMQTSVERIGRFLVIADASSLQRDGVLTAAEGVVSRLDQIWRTRGKGTIFVGPPILLLLPNRDRWTLLEASVFNHTVAPEANECVHYLNGDPAIVLCESDALAAQRAAVAATTRGWLHRFKSPRPLPPWITQGVAHHQARLGIGDMARWDQPRARAIEWIRLGGDVAGVLGQDWSMPGWADVGGRSAAVAGAVIDFLSRIDEAAVGRMIESIKGGEMWEDALSSTFGMDAGSMVGRFRQFIEVNQ